MQKAVARPQDVRVKAALELQVEDILREDAVFATEIACLWEEAKAAGAMIIAAGERSVAAQKIEGSTIITGDQNKVKS